MVSLAVVGVLKEETDDICIKWPNDIYWHDKKIAGILIENDLCGSNIQYSVIGIGLNLNQQEFEGDAPNPVSLRQITGKTYDREDVLKRIVKRIYMLFFTQKGRCYWLKVYEIPEGAKNTKGRAIQNLLNIDSDDKVNAFIRIKQLDDPEFNKSHFLLFCTKQGVIKKTSLEAYSRPRTNGVNAITIREDDAVIQVRMTDGNHEIVMANRNGRAIRFNESKVREMGRTATGVRGMMLDDDGDEVVGMG